MITSPITRRLFRLFVLVLLLFALLAGVLTAVLGRRAVQENYERTLLQRARATAAALSSVDSPFLENNVSEPSSPAGRGHMSGMRARGSSMMGGMHGRDLRFLDQLLMANVWILDRHANEIAVGTEGSPLDYQNLGPDAQSLVERIFSGEEVISRNFSSILGDTSITAGVPLRDPAGQPVAALLLHDRVEGFHAFLSHTAFLLLISTGLAVVAVLFLSAVFARRFSRPLLHMGEVTRRLAEGETGIVTGIHQEDEVGALAADIDTLSNKLEEAKNREKELEMLRRDFSTKLSHELKTPVTVMRSSLEALKDGLLQDPEEIRQSYEVLYQESQQLDRLITDLLELTALQNPHFRLSMETVNLPDILRDAVRSQRTFAREKDIETRVTAAADHLPIRGDYGRLRQMFITIIQNAIKYSPRHAEISIEQTIKEGRICVTITNPSPPMDPKELEQMFTQFYRAHDREKGFGLGLPIAREIAQHHGIRMEIKNTAEEGMAFIFLFPPQPDESWGQ